MCQLKFYILISFFVLFNTILSGQNIDSLLRIRDEAKTLQEKFEAELLIINTYVLNYQLVEAQSYIKDLIQIANRLKDSEYKAEAYKVAGVIADYQNQYDVSDSLYVIALQYATKKETKAKIYDRRFQILVRKGGIEKGAIFLQKMRENIDDTTGLLMLDYYFSLSNYHGEKGDMLNKLIYLQKAKKLAIQHDQSVQMINYNLTAVFEKLNAYENTLKLHLELRQIAQQKKEYSELFAFFGIMGAYNGLKDYDNVKKYGYTAINFKEQTGETTAFGYVYYLLGYAHLKEKQLDSAEYYFYKGIEISEQQNEARELSENHSGLCELYYLKGDLEKAKFHGEETMKHISYLHQDNNSILGKVYAKSGDYEKAYELLRTNWTEWEKEQEERYDYKIISTLLNEKFEDEIATLQKDKNLQSLTIRNQNYLVIIAVVIILLLGGIGLFFWKQNQYRKVLTENQEKIIEQERQTNEAKTRFFSNISHELKTPLTLIINPVQKLLQRNDMSKEESRYLMKSIEKNSLQLYDLTQQILELGKFEFNRVDVNETELHLFKAVQKVFSEFESYAEVRKIDFQLRLNLKEDLVILTDQYKFITIFKNLISNALKYTPERGEVIFSVTEKENELLFSVKDTGSGIHQSDLPYIFDRYYQAKMNHTIIEGGTGIGLAICKEYINLLNGNIQVTSNFGNGSLFTVTLPKKVAATTEILALSSHLTINNTPKINTSTSSEVNDATDLPSILVVEDNIDLREYLQHVLSPYFKITLAYHGKEALNILNIDKNIELIVSDVMMPVMDGYTFLTHLKQSEYASIPVIMLTALSSMDQKLKALRLGVDDYILKPFVDEELIARIDNLLENANQRREYQALSKVETTNIESSTTISPNKESNNRLAKEDLLWLEELEHIVNKHIHYTNFSVEQLADKMLLSRSSLFRKVKTLVGLTPMQYIKEVRLLKARQILENKEYNTIKAVAYAVGYKAPKNFSRNFEKRFGKKPSDYFK